MPQFAVIFDMDGVIVDNNIYHDRAWQIFLEKYDIEMSEADFKNIYGRTNRDCLNYIFHKSLAPEKTKQFSQEKEAIYREIYRPHLVPVKGLLSWLQQLKANRIPVALASSSPPVNIDFVLNNLGIKDYFTVIVDGESVQNGKPDPEIYLKAAQALAINPKSCVVFEDSLAGIRAAVAAGMQVCGVCTSHTHAEMPEVEMAIADFSGLRVEDLRTQCVSASGR